MSWDSVNNVATCGLICTDTVTQVLYSSIAWLDFFCQTAKTTSLLVVWDR